MKESFPVLTVTRIDEVKRGLGRWIRLARQRREWTQPMLASRSGVPCSTLSRLERLGEGSLDSMCRLLQALGELDGLQDFVMERVRKAGLPTDLSDLLKRAPMRQRVRPLHEKRACP